MKIGGEPVRHDAHDNHRRNPNDNIGGEEEGGEPASAERHFDGVLSACIMGIRVVLGEDFGAFLSRQMSVVV